MRGFRAKNFAGKDLASEPGKAEVFVNRAAAFFQAAAHDWQAIARKPRKLPSGAAPWQRAPDWKNADFVPPKWRFSSGKTHHFTLGHFSNGPADDDRSRH